MIKKKEKKYRILRKNEIVREGDEVKSTCKQCINYEECINYEKCITSSICYSLDIRKLWTDDHNYADTKVSNCYGNKTGLERTFRREVKSKK